MAYALCNCTVIDGRKNMRPRPNTTVLVKGSRIMSIQDANASITSGFEEIDLTDKYLLPGLINLHTHSFGSGKPSKTLSGGFAQKAILAFARTKAGHAYLDKTVAANLQTQLASGVTTVRGVGDFHYSDVRVRNLINTGKIPGPRYLCSGPAITVSNGHGAGTFADIAETPAEYRAAIAERVANGVDLIKICITGGVMDSTEKGEAGLMRMNESQVHAAVEAAHAAGLKVASHTESEEGVMMCASQGVDTIEHAAPFDEQTAGRLLANGSAIVTTTSVAYPMWKLPGSQSKLPEVGVYNAGVVTQRVIDGAKDARKYGIPLGLGTDSSCPFVTHYDMWRELYDYVKLTDATTTEAIYAATLSGAQILGLEDETGSIEEGKCADLIVVDNNPIEDLKTLRNVRMVASCGKLNKNPNFKRNTSIDQVLDELL